jgi:hypothetical protein
MELSRREFMGRALLGAGYALLAGPLLRAVPGMGRASLFRPGILRYGGHWDGRPTCLRTVLSEVERRTSVEVAREAVRISAGDERLFERPFLWMSGDRPMEAFSPAAVENLRRHVRFGGTLFVDDTSGREDSEFAASFQREMERIFPGRRLESLEKDHALYRSFYHLKRPAGRREVSDELEAIVIDDRAAVIFSRNDLSGALERDGTGAWQYPMAGAPMEARDLSLRLGVNLVIYAMTVNYKLDQVQISYQLRHPGRYPEATP